MKVRVLKAWTASYADPIYLAKRDTLFLTGKMDTWGGHIWVWAKCADGREGWIPDTLPVTCDGVTRARSAYTAQELTCAQAQILCVLNQTHGWSFCQSEDLREGWVPDSHLAVLQDD